VHWAERTLEICRARLTSCAANTVGDALPETSRRELSKNQARHRRRRPPARLISRAPSNRRAIPSSSARGLILIITAASRAVQWSRFSSCRSTVRLCKPNRRSFRSSNPAFITKLANAAGCGALHDHRKRSIHTRVCQILAPGFLDSAAGRFSAANEGFVSVAIMTDMTEHGDVFGRIGDEIEEWRESLERPPSFLRDRGGDFEGECSSTR